jgi:hypothetical protein
MWPLCFLSQHPPERKTGGNLDRNASMHPISMLGPLVTEIKKGEASPKRSPLLNEPVGGRLIRVLYWHIRGNSFHFF